MKCPECGGKGKSVYFVEVDRDENSVTIEKREGICLICKGSGEYFMTNADRLRSMSDKELASFLSKKFTDFTVNRNLDFGNIPTATGIEVERETWFRVWIQWLRMPVED